MDDDEQRTDANLAEEKEHMDSTLFPLDSDEVALGSG